MTCLIPVASRCSSANAATPASSHLEIRQLEFDYTVPAYLESVDPASYDNLVLLPSERLKSEAESDARTILGYLLLREMMQDAYRQHRGTWNSILNRDEVTLVCFCKADSNCHRYLLSDYFTQLGAEYMGEREL